MERAGRQPNTLEEHIIKTFILDSGMATDFAVYITTISRTKTFSQTKSIDGYHKEPPLRAMPQKD